MVPTGRFAPPLGRMHLGNIYAALMSWLSARSAGGRWILRIEDLDPGRSRIEYARLIEDDLKWLGLEWDEGGLTDGSPDPTARACAAISTPRLWRALRTKGWYMPAGVPAPTSWPRRRLTRAMAA